MYDLAQCIKSLASALREAFPVSGFVCPGEVWAAIQPQVMGIDCHAKREVSFSICSFPRSIIFSKAAGSREMR